MNRKIASNFEMSRTPFLDLRRSKRHRRILRNIQKLRTLQVLVAVWFPRVDRGGIDRHLDRGLCHVALVHVDRSVERVKLPAHLRNHQMRHGKLRGTVLRIDLVDRSLRKTRQPSNGHQATRDKHLRKISFHSFFSCLCSAAIESIACSLCPRLRQSLAARSSDKPRLYHSLCLPAGVPSDQFVTATKDTRIGGSPFIWGCSFGEKNQ